MSVRVEREWCMIVSLGGVRNSSGRGVSADVLSAWPVCVNHGTFSLVNFVNHDFLNLRFLLVLSLHLLLGRQYLQGIVDLLPISVSTTALTFIS